MPRQKVIHLNSPEDDIHTGCGMQIAGKLWTLNPNQVTCQRPGCKNSTGMGPR